MRNIMVDIETLGTRPGCVVLSIGAVEFDEDAFCTGREFHAHIDAETATDCGLVVCPRTVMWWLDQEKEAQNALLDREAIDIGHALIDFVDSFEWQDTLVWANGASFDFPILEHAMEAAGLNVPWAFYNLRDFRTLKNLVSKEIYKELKATPNIAHDALEDARAQAITAMRLINRLRGFGNKTGVTHVA